MAQTMGIRSFIAISLGETAIQNLRVVAERKKILDQFKAISWVYPKNYHLTLSFLGNLQSDKLDDLQLKLTDLTLNYHPFDISMEIVCGFPFHQKPTTISAIISKSDELLILHDQITNMVSSLKIPINKKVFKPHVTLGRIKRKINLEKIIEPSQILIKSNVNSVDLYHSELKSSGPIYSLIFTQEFLGKITSH
ncbi:MAG: RNA 2',3'-cyclic phosphodiesterase [Deltaproteobacteria bacterium]|nr:RNA 2',3'-cyclic phosphodiesterase [Deltaproteobacteria bacterium]